MRTKIAYIFTKSIRDQNAVGGSAATRYDPQALLELVDQMAAIRASLFAHYPDQRARLVTYDVDLVSFMNCFFPSVALTTVRSGKVYIDGDEAGRTQPQKRSLRCFRLEAMEQATFYH